MDGAEQYSWVIRLRTFPEVSVSTDLPTVCGPINDKNSFSSCQNWWILKVVDTQFMVIIIVGLKFLFFDPFKTSFMT